MPKGKTPAASSGKSKVAPQEHHVEQAELDMWKTKGTIGSELFKQQMGKAIARQAYQGPRKAPRRLTQLEIKKMYPEVRAACNALYSKIAAVRKARSVAHKVAEKRTGLSWAQIVGGAVQGAKIDDKDKEIAELRAAISKEKKVEVSTSSTVASSLKQENTALLKKVQELTATVTKLSAAVEAISKAVAAGTGSNTSASSVLKTLAEEGSVSKAVSDALKWASKKVVGKAEAEVSEKTLRNRRKRQAQKARAKAAKAAKA